MNSSNNNSRSLSPRNLFKRTSKIMKDNDHIIEKYKVKPYSNNINNLNNSGNL